MLRKTDSWPNIFFIVIVTLFAGVPISILSIFFLSKNISQVATLICICLIFLFAISLVVFRYRNQIVLALFGQKLRNTEEMAQTFTKVVSAAVKRDNEKFEHETQVLARSIGAQYAWLQTRSWMIGTFVAFAATFTALAGAALLYQQNKLFEKEINALNNQFELERERIRTQRRTELISYLWERDAQGLPEANARTRYEALIEYVEMVKLLSKETYLNENPSNETTKLKKIDLRGAMLTDLDLREIDLEELDLRGANLQRSNLSGIVATGVDFGGADLSGVIAIGANLQNANFKEVCIIGGTLAQSDLSDANFVGANLKDTNLYSANLSGAELHDLNLNGVDFYLANLSSVEIYDADLRKANFIEAKLDKENINGDNMYCETIRPDGSTILGSDCDKPIQHTCKPETQ